MNFFSFQKVDYVFYESAPVQISLPDSIRSGIVSVDLLIKRYLLDNKLTIVENKETVSIIEKQTANIKCIQKDIFFMEVSCMKNAAEIERYVTKIYNEIPNVFSDEFIHSLRKIVEIERFYGNAKETIIKELKKYFDTLSI